MASAMRNLLLPYVTTFAEKSRAVRNGSQQWDILCRKYYNEEVKKLGV
jgi:hypothetical protein